MKDKVVKLIKINEVATGEMRVTIPIELVKELGFKKAIM